VSHERVKAAVGIATANCESCRFLGSDGDGGEPEYAVDWPVCNKVDRYQYLTSFPFKKEMSCWEPNFWHSKFAEQLTGEQIQGWPNDTAALDAFDEALRLAGTP
jgi:hypothetical protein